MYQSSWSSLGIFPNRCRQVRLYHHIISVIIQGIVAVLLLIRTYALYGRDRRVLALLLTIGCTGGAVGLWAITVGAARQGHKTANVPARSQFVVHGTGCDTTLSQQQGYDLALTWGSMLVFDATVFVLTLSQAFKSGRTWKGGYIHVMLRDGSVYFGVLLVFHSFNILTLALAGPAYRGITVSLTNVISSTLVTRLMLNIRDPDLHERACRWDFEEIDV
ncbi:hypothetical protein C8Q78DRAFT_215045 [Trametes maxima]|nr:hypothetical protein C8Q78DRAFT_215045 [Trametes maxima]